MAVWDFRQLQQNLERKTVPSLLMVFGDEDYLIAESLKLIKAQALNEGAIDFNYDQFFAGDDSAVQVRDAAETLPMLCERRLVVYRDVHKLKDRDWEQLYPIVEDPLDSVCLVLVSSKVDKRKKFFKLCSKYGQLIELKKPYENQIPVWIDYIAFNHGLKLSRDSQALIHQIVGTNLAEINSEMAKLKQYVGDRSQINNEDVLKVVSPTRVDSVFDLTEAIGRKDRVAALISLANLLDHGQNEVGVLALILRHVRILASLKEGLEQGLRGAKLCAKVGVPSFFLQKYLDQSSRWPEHQIVDTIKALHETDKALKSSPTASHIWLENFILKTC